MPPAHTTLNASMVILRVQDLDRAAEFYTARLGLKPTRRFEGFVFLDAGPITLILNRPEKAPPSVTSGLTEVVFEVADIHAAHRDLESRGVLFLAPPFMVGSTDTYDRWAAPFRDPDGHLLSITATVPRGKA